MTEKQLEEIKEFAKTFYDKTDQFHDMRHAELTVKYALKLAKDYSETDLKVLEAACILHDIGRINVDDGHPYESAKIAKPFLENLKINSEEIEKILHAVYVHGVKDIPTAKNIEAKILFDSDKIQQLTVYGFLKHLFFYVAEQKIDMIEAVDKIEKHIEKALPNIQTEKAKKIIDSEIKKIKEIISDFRKGLNAELI